MIVRWGERRSGRFVDKAVVPLVALSAAHSVVPLVVRTVVQWVAQMVVPMVALPAALLVFPLSAPTVVPFVA